MRCLWMIVCLCGLLSFAAFAAEKTPVLYVTDLYHPHSDPDDHYDLMMLYAFEEFDVRGIVIDRGEKAKGRAGICALDQMKAITGRRIPYALGLMDNLSNPSAQMREAPKGDQAGVGMILKVLAEAEKAITIFSTGSARDLAAAYNRDPDLFHKKVGRLYLNAGCVEKKPEWNVKLDPHAYACILRSGLPLYWAPCFGQAGWETFWSFEQGKVLKEAPPPLKQFFLFMLRKEDLSTVDPLSYLKAPIKEEQAQAFYDKRRNMWCTGPFLHAAGRPTPGSGFFPLKVYLDAEGVAHRTGAGAPLELTTFRIEDQEAYAAGMLAVLITTVQDFPIKDQQ